MFRSTLAAAATVVLAGGAALAEPAPYTFDETHTEIRATWNHMGNADFSVNFTDYEGTLELDFEEPSNSTVDVTFSLEDGYWLGADQDRFNTHFASPDLFNIAEFPTAHFVATGFETEDGATGTMTGDLTLLDQTHPVTLDVTLNQRAPHPFDASVIVAGFTATGTIQRSQWGLDYAVPAVSDDIQLVINTELRTPNPDAAEAE